MIVGTVPLCILDLDGTALDADRKVPARLLTALSRLHTLGFHFTVATGRGLYLFESLKLAPAFLNVIGETVVLRDGDVIYDWRRRQVMHRRLLPDQVGVMLDDLPIVVDTGDHLYSTSAQVGLRFAMEYTVRRPTLLRDNVGSLDGLVRVSTYADHGTIRSRLTGLDVEISTSVDGKRVHVTPRNTCKAAGTSGVVEAMGSRLSECIAFGDGANDECLLRAAGLGVAVLGSSAGARFAADVALNVDLADWLDLHSWRTLRGDVTRCPHVLAQNFGGVSAE